MFFKFESIDYAFIIFWLVLLDFCPGDIASRSCGATIRLVYDLHHIARSVLHQIGEEHRIARHDQEASTSRGPSIRPPVSSTQVRMQPIRGRGRGRVDRRGRGTSEPTLPPLSSTPIFAPDSSIRVTPHPLAMAGEGMPHGTKTS